MKDNNSELNSNGKDEGTISTKMKDKRIPITNEVAIKRGSLWSLLWLKHSFTLCEEKA